jgi:hypothetical protein
MPPAWFLFLRIALVILDEPYETYMHGRDTEKVEVVGMPVVCLAKREE